MTDPGQRPVPAPPAAPSVAPPSAPPTPREIARALGERVIGQRAAVREMSIALAKHLAGVATGNILLIGSSGTGKTTLMRAVEGYLAADPALAARSTLVRLHANVLAREAERGRPGEAVLGRLLERARETAPGAGRDELLERVAHGIVFVDEVDKIRARVGDRPNVAGIRAQEALLTLIENESVPFALPEALGGDASRGQTVRIDSSGLLFVAAGAFEGLYDAVYDRVTIGRDRGALKPVTRVEAGRVVEEHSFALRDWLRNEDVFDYGMTPQFLSRFDAMVLLDDLTVDELVQVFLRTPESGYTQSSAYFAARGIHLALSPAAVRRIAEAAARQPRLGARALREVFRRVVRDYEFDPESAPSGADGALLIDAPDVDAALAR
jgi:ATP-dependent Clp protease ATP-binding subunit ClpX